MRVIFISFLIIFLNSCSLERAEDKKGIDSTSLKTEVSKEDTTIKEDEIDCVFDTSTFKFTSEAIDKFDSKVKFHWDDKEKQAIIPFDNGDTLILHIGGCNHFSYLAIYRTDSSKFNDESFLLEKARWIARNFFSNGFDKNFDRFISTGKYSQNENSNPFLKSYSIQVDSTVLENEVYDGFSFKKEGLRTEIFMDGYVN